MGTPWERYTSGNAAYRSWLLKVMTEEDYNQLDGLGRRTLLSQFDRDQADTSVAAGVMPVPASVDDLINMIEGKGPHTFRSVPDARDGLINGNIIERQDTLRELSIYISRLIDASGSERTLNDKENFPIACTVCGSGGGKTTLCGLIEQVWIDKEIKNALNLKLGVKRMPEVHTMKTAFATFNSSCNYGEREKSHLSAKVSLGIRLVASRYGWSHKQVSDYLLEDPQNPDWLKYKELELRIFLEKLCPASATEAVIILIDEIMRLDESAANDILIELSNFQQECLRRGQKVFVVVTSLTSKPPATLTRATQRRVQPISLPPISPGEVLKQANVFADTFLNNSTVDPESLRHHLMYQFCATGGIVKTMKEVIKFFDEKLQTDPVGLATADLYSGIPAVPDLSWGEVILRCSIFNTPLDQDYTVVGEGQHETKLEDLILDHRVVVIKNVLDASGLLNSIVRIPTFILRALANHCYTRNSEDPSSNHLYFIMQTLSQNRQMDGSYSKIFEIAVMRVLCLRLSLAPKQETSLAEILPHCFCPFNLQHLLGKAVRRVDCTWVEVESLTPETVKSDRDHGTMVFSKKVNEGAVEGFWVLILDEKVFYVFLQMKFWGSCGPAKIKTWEASIHERATKEYGLHKGQYVPLFFSTSPNFQVNSSISMAMEDTKRILDPFGICPMMLKHTSAGKKRKGPP